MLSPKAIGKSPSVLLLASRGSKHSLVHSCITAFCVSVFIWPSSLCVSSPLERTPVMASAELTSSAKAVFLSSHSGISGGCEFGGMLFNYCTFPIKNGGGNSLAAQ